MFVTLFLNLKSQQGGPASSQAASLHPNSATDASSTPQQQLSSTGQQPGAAGAAAHSQNTQVISFFSFKRSI